MKKLVSGPLEDATYQISKLCAFKIQARKTLKFSLFVPIFVLVTTRGGTSFDPRGIVWRNLVEIQGPKNFRILTRLPAIFHSTYS